jgi:carbamoyl-phosphate synthase large subunit
MSMHVPILITGAGTATAQSVIKALRSQDELKVRIVAADMNPLNAGRFMADTFCEIPPASDASFVPTLRKICRREAIRLLIPIVDDEFLPLASEKASFEHLQCRVAIPDPPVVEICCEKDRTFRFFQSHAIPTPPTYAPEELDGLRVVPYPLVGKPRKGRATRDVERIDCDEQLRLYRNRISDAVFQQWVDGEEYTIDTFADFSGRLLCAVPRRRVETKAGVSNKGLVVRHQEMILKARHIVESLGLTGPANIQCFQTKEGLRFTEINPRFSAGLPLTVEAGVPTPLWLLKLTVGQPVSAPPIGTFRENLAMVRYWQEFFTSWPGH